MKIKLGIITAFVLAGVLSLTACSSVSDVFSKKDKEETTTVETTTVEESAAMEKLAEIDSVFSYNGQKVELPVSYSQFAKQFDYVMKPDTFSDYDENTSLDANSYFLHYDYDNDMTLTIANMSSSPKALKDCDILGIELEFDRTNNFDYHGLSWDSSADDIANRLGKPQSTFSSDGSEYITYNKSDDRDCDLTVSFSLRKGNLSTFKIAYSYWDMTYQTMYDFDFDFDDDSIDDDIIDEDFDGIDVVKGLVVGDTCVIEEMDLQYSLPENWTFTTGDDETLSAISLEDGTNIIVMCYDDPEVAEVTEVDLDAVTNSIIESVSDEIYDTYEPTKFDKLPFAVDVFSAFRINGTVKPDVSDIGNISHIIVNAVKGDCLIQIIITATDADSAQNCLNNISNISNTF